MSIWQAMKVKVKAFLSMAFHSMRQVKKAEIRTFLQTIDKEMAATVTYDEFLDMAAPKVANRDEREEIQKVRTTLSKRGTEGSEVRGPVFGLAMGPSDRGGPHGLGRRVSPFMCPGRFSRIPGFCPL